MYIFLFNLHDVQNTKTIYRHEIYLCLVTKLFQYWRHEYIKLLPTSKKLKI